MENLENKSEVYLQIPVDRTKARALVLDISNVIVISLNYNALHLSFYNIRCLLTVGSEKGVLHFLTNCTKLF